MRLQPGDLMEIETGDGFGYAQVTHIHPAYPEVLRILHGLSDHAVSDPSSLAQRQTAFVTMFPLGGALENGTLSGRKIGTLPVPGDHKAFPTFKMPIRDKQGGVVYWWLWEGDGLHYSVESDSSFDAFPMREVMAAPDLIQRLRRPEAS